MKNSWSEKQSAVFKKELGLTDLVLTPDPFYRRLARGSALPQSKAHRTLFFGLRPSCLFYIPSAVVVIYLNRQCRSEGGVLSMGKTRFE
jgi:hypothetical protein